jgi:hypothetical protein
MDEDILISKKSVAKGLISLNSVHAGTVLEFCRTHHRNEAPANAAGWLGVRYGSSSIIAMYE